MTIDKPNITQQLGNTFAQRSASYAQNRPRYPRALYEWIVSQCPNRDAAWDCATGSGQAAIDLAAYFGKVYASDVSAEQITHADRALNVSYSVQGAERTTYSDAAFDLVTVAQALHWFDHAKFWAEVRRVCKPRALFCAWGYAWFDCESEIMETLVRPFRELISPHWAPNNRILWDGYRDQDIAWPFARIEAPLLAIEVNWTIAELLAYMKTWSAYKRAESDPKTAGKLRRLEEETPHLLDKRPLNISMPLAIVAGHVE